MHDAIGSVVFGSSRYLSAMRLKLLVCYSTCAEVIVRKMARPFGADGVVCDFAFTAVGVDGLFVEVALRPREARDFVFFALLGFSSFSAIPTFIDTMTSKTQEP